MSTPWLSVVMPTYNRKESLRVALEGLARQTVPADRFEVVVVSDGSTDGTNALLEEWANIRAFPYRLRPIVQTNAGPACARNRGIREAQGEVIVFIDDDVEAAPGFLAAHAAYHETEERVVIIGPMSPDPALRWQEPCWIAWEHAMLEKQYRAWRTGEWKGAGPNHFYSGNASVRRAHLMAIGGFDETFKRQEDVEMAYRMERVCQVRFHFDESALGIHRPNRTFVSWKKIPFAYGSLDVVRAQRGDVAWDVLQRSYHTRNWITRRSADAWLSLPASSPLFDTVLSNAARFFYKIRQAKIALAILSTLYNLLYLQGVYEGLGKNGREMRDMLAYRGTYQAG